MLFDLERQIPMAVERATPAKAARIAQAIAEAGYDDALMLRRETAEEVLTDRRTELLEHLRDHEVGSVSALAAALDRDVAAVSRDLDRLFEYDLVTFERRGNAKVPSLKHETVVVEPIL